MNDTFKLLLTPVEDKKPQGTTIGLKDKSGRYKIGIPTRPPIRHDNGHLDSFPRREATMADHAALAIWRTKLKGSEKVCRPKTAPYVPLCSGEDLTDANAAYRHFLDGGGRDRTIDYEKYLREDPAAFNLMRILIDDFRLHAEVLGEYRSKFSVTSEYFTVGNGGIAPYPSTVNWQKAIGAHYLWISADVLVSADPQGDIWYSAAFVVHMEDRYNFNVGANDIATGIPDSENGAFELTGLAKQYTNFATVNRSFRWKKGDSSDVILESEGYTGKKYENSPSR